MEGCRVQACFRAESHGLANGEQIYGCHNLIAELGRLAVAHRAKMCDAFSHRVEDWARAFKCFMVSAYHDREGGFDRAFLPTRNRSVQPEKSFCTGFPGQLTSDLR